MTNAGVALMKRWLTGQGLSGWREKAACRDTPAGLFDITEQAAGTHGTYHPEALAYCARCPVIDACLGEAIAQKQEGVIRGGLVLTSVAERAACETCGVGFVRVKNRGNGRRFCAPRACGSDLQSPVVPR